MPAPTRTAGALLIHGHVDVVPADPSEWSVDPFSGAVQDGYVWGRGAVDMKDMVAMMVAVARDFKTDGVVPPRDLIFAFMSDEEAGGAFGRAVAGRQPPGAVRGCHRGDQRGRRLLRLARRHPPGLSDRRCREGHRLGNIWASGRAGHGSMVNDDNAVTKVAGPSPAGRPPLPARTTATVDAFLVRITELTGLEFPDDDLEGAIRKLGPVSRLVSATLHNTANPTMLKAGYKANVIPSVAQATVDCRVLPGSEEMFRQQVAEIVGDDVEIEWSTAPPLEYPFEGGLVEAMKSAIRAEDPDGYPVPYMLSGGTDNKAFHRLGIAG